MISRAVAFVVALTLFAAPAAEGFDSGPHADLTINALLDEGFGQTGSVVARLNNWWVDMYSTASKNPFSGHADVIPTLVGGGYGFREHWPDDLVAAVSNLHFDAREANRTPAGIEAE